MEAIRGNTFPLVLCDNHILQKSRERERGINKGGKCKDLKAEKRTGKVF